MTIVFILLIFAIIAIAAIGVYVAVRGSSGPRYHGEAPHKGKVMRFTGTSSQVKEDSGQQRTTKV